MNHRLIVSLRAAALGLLLVLAGCTKSPPPITEVEGTVLLNEQPLPHALVTFVPELQGFGAEQNSTAVTDEKGKFKLVCARNGEAGAVVAKHHVVVVEGPLPEGLRGMNAQDKAAEFQAKLKNRPIPETYGNYAKTPLIVEVKTDQKEYVLKMAR